jgi:hypothetical protein
MRMKVGSTVATIVAVENVLYNPSFDAPSAKVEIMNGLAHRPILGNFSSLAFNASNWLRRLIVNYLVDGESLLFAILV